MHRTARGAEMTNLRAAREPIGDDDCVGRRLVDRRNQNSLADGLRYFEMSAVVAECARHPAATRVEHIELCARRARQQRDFIADTRDSFLMAMTLHDSSAAQFGRQEVRGLAGEKLIE